VGLATGSPQSAHIAEAGCLKPRRANGESTRPATITLGQREAQKDHHQRGARGSSAIAPRQRPSPGVTTSLQFRLVSEQHRRTLELDPEKHFRPCGARPAAVCGRLRHDACLRRDTRL
jgi:hypothetical protein